MDSQIAGEADQDVSNSAKSEETLVPRETRGLPPKMRMMWARKESVSVNKGTPAVSMLPWYSNALK